MSDDKAENSIELKFKNIKLEIKILAYILQVDYTHAFNLKESFFSVKPLKDFLRAVKKLKLTLTKEMLLEQLKKQNLFKKDNIKDVYQYYVDEIYKTSLVGITNKNFNLLLKQLYDLSASRKVLSVIKDITSNIDNFDIEKVKEQFKVIANDTYQLTDELTGNYVDDYEKRKEKIVAQEGIDFCIPTGIKEFDKLIGGLMPSEFGIVLGRTGLGKTAFLIGLLTHAAYNGYNVAFATGEMPTLQIQYRIDSSITGISGQKFRRRIFEEKDFTTWESKINVMRSMLDTFIEVQAFPKNFNMNNVETWMHRIQDKHGKPIHLLLIDYINIMQAVQQVDGDRQSREAQSNTVWDLKTLVETFNDGKICAWSPGQVTDEYLYAERLTVEAAKYARAISETAPVIGGLVQTDDDALFNEMQFQVLKVRGAKVPVDPIILHPDLDVMRINSRIFTGFHDLIAEDKYNAERKEERESRTKKKRKKS